MLMSIVAVCAFIILVSFAICRFLGPHLHRFGTNGEEKIGLSKNKLYNANGYIVHSGSDILLGSTGSFKRFDSVDRNAYEGELVASMQTPPWTNEEQIPPQPLRPAPIPTSGIIKNINHVVYKQQSLDPKPSSSAPVLKSVPRPIPRKQNSAPGQIHLINPPENNLQKMVKDIQATTNPFLNGLINFESIKSNFFSTTIETSDFKIENERATKSAVISKNPFKSTSSDSNSFFDFHPSTIKSIMEETPDDGYEGDNDDIEDENKDPLKQLEERIQKIEASGKQRRRSTSQSPPRYSPKLLNKQSTSTTPVACSPDNSSHKPNTTSELSINTKEKFVDSSLYTDEDLAMTQSYRKHIRNRSLSENETSELNMFTDHSDYVDQTSPVSLNTQTTPTNPFHNPKKRLLKTPSETYLEQFSMMRSNNNNNNNSNSPSAVNKTTQLCKHPSLTKILHGPQSLFDHSDSSHSLTSATLKRTLSCESISSESSVIMSTLEKPTPPVTGNLCIALQYDKHTATEEGCELLVSILEAKDLAIPSDADPDYVDTFVRVYLVPDESGAMQTKIFKNSKHPSYQESFGFFITKQIIKRSLWFHLYHTNANCTTLIGETEMKLSDFKKPVTTWLQLSDSRNNTTNAGDLMFSLSYLPTAERLTVVVVKARNLRPGNDENENNSSNTADDCLNEIHNVFVKVYLLKNDKKVSKKRTSTKRGESNPIFNEAMMFSIPPYLLNSIQVRLTVMNVAPSESNGTVSSRKSQSAFGHVIVGSRTDGKGLLHWHQMITSLRKPVAFFHPLRRSTNKNQNHKMSLRQMQLGS